MNSTFSRYRPAVVTVVTVTLGCSLWYVYNVYNSKPPATLHRSNAVHHRQNPVRNAHASASDTDNNTNAAAREDQNESASNDQHDAAETVAGSEHLAQQRHSRDGTNLKELLYYIAEDQSRVNGYVHRGVMCNGCYMKPIRGVRWRCANCADYDLCSDCESTGIHSKTHIFYKVKIPAPFLGNPRQCQPIAYPGKPEDMARELPVDVSKRLATKTRFEKEEIDALYDQFTCLANSAWPDDDLGIKFAIDRRAFDTAFIPLTSISAPKPNLLYDRIFAYYDSDRNGLIGFEELLIGLSHVQHKARDPDRRRLMIFNGFDLDSDGFISRKDVLRLFRAYYAIQKDITHDLIAVQEEDFDMRNVSSLINGSQPLSAVFTEPPPPVTNGGSVQSSKPANTYGDRRHGNNALYESSTDDCLRSEVIEATIIHNDRPVLEPKSESDSSATFTSSRPETSDAQEPNAQEQEYTDRIYNRMQKTEFYTDFEEGCLPNQEPLALRRTPLGYLRSASIWQDDNDVAASEGENAISLPTNTMQRYSKGDYKIEISIPDTSVGSEILYQVVLEGLNELLDPLFKAKEDLALEVDRSEQERSRWKTLLAELSSETAVDPKRAPATSPRDISNVDGNRSSIKSTKSSAQSVVEDDRFQASIRKLTTTKDQTMPQFRPNALKDIVPVPSAARLKRLYELEMTAKDIEDAGGPGRLNLKEFTVFMESEPGRKLAFVDSWFELGSF